MGKEATILQADYIVNANDYTDSYCSRGMCDVAIKVVPVLSLRLL